MVELSGLPLLFQTFNAFQRTEALKAAIELDVFTAIAEGHDTPAMVVETIINVVCLTFGPYTMVRLWRARDRLERTFR